MRICNCIAIYGEDKNNYDISIWFNSILRFFGELGYNPNLGNFSAPKYSQKKAMAFEELNKKLASINFKGVDLITLYSTHENFTNLIDGWYVHALLNIKQLTGFICFDENVHRFDKDLIQKFVLDIAPSTDVKYGIAYPRNFEKGPALYALGSTSGLNGKISDERIEKNQITKWLWDSYGDRSYLKGILRDIYPANILTEIHLNRDIGNKTLKQWIQKENMGELYSINDFLWMWLVDDNSIIDIKSSLVPSGIILCI